MFETKVVENLIFYKNDNKYNWHKSHWKRDIGKKRAKSRFFWLLTPNFWTCGRRIICEFWDYFCHANIQVYTNLQLGSPSFRNTGLNRPKTTGLLGKKRRLGSAKQRVRNVTQYCVICTGITVKWQIIANQCCQHIFLKILYIVTL